MSFNAQVIRQLIDRVDTQLKAAVGTGSIEKEFRKERKNIDKVMHMLRDNRNDAELQREFKEPRFLWVITERYHKAKKTGGGITGDFWEGLKEALDQFESPGRSKTPPPIRQPTSPPPVRPTLMDSASQRRRHQPKNEVPVPVPAARKGKDRMKAEVEEEEEEEEEKEEEKEKEEEREEERGKGEEEEGEGDGWEGEDEDGWEGEEEVEVETPVRHQRRKADVNRRPPQPSGKYRHIPCRRCHRMGKECMEQAQGFACLLCAKTKSKCEPGSKRRENRGEGEAGGSRKPAPTKMTKARPSQPKLAPAPPKLRRKIKSAVYVFSSAQEPQADETKAGPSRLAPEKGSKAGPSKPAPAKPESWRKIREAVSLFSTDEEPKPREKKETGKAKQDNAGALWEAMKAHKHQHTLFDYRIGTIQHQMDEQDKLLETMLQQNDRTQGQVRELGQELAKKDRILAAVYKRLGKAEQQIALLSRPQVALAMPMDVTPRPPTTTVASTQTEGPVIVTAPTTLPAGGKMAIPSTTLPSAQIPPAVGEIGALREMPAPPITTAPLDPPTIEVQGPTPQNSQEGETGTSLLKVPPAQVEPDSTEPDRSRRSQTRSRSPAPNPADLRRSPRLATPLPSMITEPTPSSVTDQTEPRRSPRLATPGLSPGSLKRPSPPADNERPAKRRHD